ncbi:MAG: glycosyltransferase family 4 protein [Pirellulales bacterium]|nr:glycosyltransferase family 4 protein [Pirellulales bacterium]
MKLLALTEEANHVCFRYRIEAFAPALAERGWDLVALPLDRHTLSRLGQLCAAQRADVVVLQRKLLPRWQLWLLRRFSRVLVYDFDDAVFLRDSYSRKRTSNASRQARFRATLRAADAVIAGNAWLLGQAACHVAREKVHLVPTCVDPRLYRPATHEPQAGSARLAWIGQRSTLPSLYCAQPHLAAAARQLRDLELRVICNEFPDLEGVRVVPRLWSAEQEADELSSCHIGICWLPDDVWSQGKCGLKVLQYMAAGLPVVANPVGMNKMLVIHGETGFLAQTPEEWSHAICRLARDAQLRRRMGQAARCYVSTCYGVQQWAPQFAELIDRWGAQGAESLGSAATAREAFVLDRRRQDGEARPGGATGCGPRFSSCAKAAASVEFARRV